MVHAAWIIINPVLTDLIKDLVYIINLLKDPHRHAQIQKQKNKQKNKETNKKKQENKNKKNQIKEYRHTHSLATPHLYFIPLLMQWKKLSKTTTNITIKIINHLIILITTSIKKIKKKHKWKT